MYTGSKPLITGDENSPSAVFDSSTSPRSLIPISRTGVEQSLRTETLGNWKVWDHDVEAKYKRATLCAGEDNLHETGPIAFSSEPKEMEERVKLDFDGSRPLWV